MGNTFAYLMLAAWPAISLIFYYRFSTITATFLCIIGGFLVLPVGVNFDPPLIPALDKESIPAITALVYCLFIKKELIKPLPKGTVEKVLIIFFISVPFFTTINNGEPFFDGSTVKPGMSFHESISAIIFQYLRLLPFILLSQLIRNEDDLIKLAKLFVISGCIYILPMIWEVRMSPNIHSSIYGFFPSVFAQTVRDGGFRPVVFLGHGLLVATYIMVCFGFSLYLIKKKD